MVRPFNNIILLKPGGSYSAPVLGLLYVTPPHLRTYSAVLVRYSAFGGLETFINDPRSSVSRIPWSIVVLMCLGRGVQEFRVSPNGKKLS